MKHIIYEQIEELRLLMEKVASDKELTDHRVVCVSEKLDLLINEYYSKERYYQQSAARDLVGQGYRNSRY